MNITSEAPLIKEFSVSDISNIIKELLENSFAYIKVKGEISGLKIASSGHGYFNLKDSNAILTCTCWRPVLAKISFPLVDGMEVVITGKITAYAGQSRYQLSATRIDPAGDGALMQMFNELKNKLTKEGLFNQALKQRIPFMPKIIGVVTSITGSVIQDIIHRISDRFPLRILIWPVSVQGDNSAQEVANAIKGFNNLLLPQDKPDIIIVARGGGSVEDLWSFNEEIVVRAVYHSNIPVISAVGHETDYTLIDLAADLRVPTPTAAAEFAVPVLADLLSTINLHYSKLTSFVSKLLRYKIQSVWYYNRISRNAMNYIELKQQRVDELGFRLRESLPNSFRFKKSQLEKFTLMRLNPTKIIEYKVLELTTQFKYLVNIILHNISRYDYKIEVNTVLLQSLDYNNVLKRGFTIIKNEKGQFISSKEFARKQEIFNINFFDGTVQSKKI